MHRVGKSLTRNQPSSSFRFSGSGRIGFESILVGFGFAGVELNLAEFWPKYCQIWSDLTRYGWYFLISIKIRPRSWWIWQKSAYIIGLKGLDLSVFGWVCDFRRGKNNSLDRSGSSVSQTTNPQLKSMVSGFCTGDSCPTVTKLWSGNFGWRWLCLGGFSGPGRSWTALF